MPKTYIEKHTKLYNQIVTCPNMPSKYLDALKGKEAASTIAVPSSRRQAMLDQKGLCAQCKKDINPMYSKFVKEADGKMTVICSGCAVTIPKR